MKKHLNKIILVVIILVAVVAVVFHRTKITSTIPENNLPFVDPTIVNYSPNPILFNPAIAMYPKDTNKMMAGNKGGIVPHHDVASRLIAELFQKLPPTKTVIIVGTNHTNGGNGLAISGNIVYHTPMGDMKTDTKIMGELVRDGLVSLDNNRLTTEHSIYVEIPFAQYYFPDAKVVPIILNSNHDMKKSFRLAQTLAKYLEDPNIVLVGSTDFSHYLPTEITARKDAETQEAVLAFDYETISHFNNDHVDSPPTVMTMLKAMQDANTKMTILNHSELSKMIGQPSVKSSTSYFTLMFVR